MANVHAVEVDDGKQGASGNAGGGWRRRREAVRRLELFSHYFASRHASLINQRWRLSVQTLFSWRRTKASAMYAKTAIEAYTPSLQGAV